MRRFRIEISAGAVLAAALLYFFGSLRFLAAILPAVLVHELGHCCALTLCGSRLTRFSVGIFGMELDYAGELDGIRSLLCALAGPLMGLIYAIIACSLGGGFLRMSGTISFLFSIFNLMPTLPLDGGRIVAAVTDPVFAGRISRCAALLLLAGGILLAAVCQSWSLLLMGLWLTISNFRM